MPILCLASHFCCTCSSLCSKFEACLGSPTAKLQPGKLPPSRPFGSHTVLFFPVGHTRMSRSRLTIRRAGTADVVLHFLPVAVFPTGDAASQVMVEDRLPGPARTSVFRCVGTLPWELNPSVRAGSGHNPWIFSLLPR